MSRLRPLAFLAVLIALFGAASLRADLVWTPGQGWRIEGGALAGLSGEEGRNALELMNTARNAEEKGSSKSAIKGYQKVAKKYPNSLYAAEALYRTGLLYEKRREYFKSFDAFQEMVMKYPSSEKFSQVVFDAGYASPVRTPRGRDILAACGQLKSESEKLSARERMALRAMAMTD